LAQFTERVTIYTTTGLYRVSFPAPYTQLEPSVFERVRGTELGQSSTEVFRTWRDSFREEIEHFADCVEHGIACRTPPQQAALDLQLLERLVSLRHQPDSVSTS